MSYENTNSQCVINTNKLNDVDKYLARVPKQARASLVKLRKIIKATVPDAEEQVSYQIPAYKYKGMLVGFASFKNHNSFMTMSPPLMKKMKDELNKYSTTTGTIHFPFDKPLPIKLIKKIVKARMKENEDKRKK